MTFATYNVISLFPKNHVKEIKEELKRKYLHILWLSEVRKKGEEKIYLTYESIEIRKKSGVGFLIRKNIENRKADGVGFLIHKRLKKYILECDSVQTEFQSCLYKYHEDTRIIRVYATTISNNRNYAQRISFHEAEW